MTDKKEKDEDKDYDDINYISSDKMWAKAQYELDLVQDYGKYPKHDYEDGAAYKPDWKGDDPYYDEDDEYAPVASYPKTCGNCIFFIKQGYCMLVEGNISPKATCKLYIVPDPQDSVEVSGSDEEEYMALAREKWNTLLQGVVDAPDTTK